SVEGKKIEGRERPPRPRCDEKEAGVKGIAILRNFAGEPDGGESHQRGEKQHHQAQAVEAESEIDIPLGTDPERAHHLVAFVVRVEAEIEDRGGGKRYAGAPECRSARRRSEQNCRGRGNRKE